MERPRHPRWYAVGRSKPAGPEGAPVASVTETSTALEAPPRTEPDAPASGPAATRLESLDVFRGVTIAGMLLVNNPGTWSAIHPPLRHAEWHGWTPTDLIFPFFLFIVGVSMTFSFGKQLERGVSRGALLGKTVRRAAILFGLGLLLHGFPNYDLSTIRIPGVLQRIALAYLAASVLVLYLKRRGQAIACIIVLVGYWAALTLVPVPGSGAGVLEPGRDLGAYIDRAVFGSDHLWIYSITWDPEGLFSTLPAVATVLTGVFAGYWIRSRRSPLEKTVGLFLAGHAALLLGIVWATVFPINKNLWTSSYVVFTSGMACHFLAVCYWLVDVRHYRRWSVPFLVFGTNAIAAFFLSSLGARILNIVRVGSGDGVPLKVWIYDTLFAPLAAPVNASLAFALAYTGFWLGVMAVLYRRRIFIKV
jgi:predicted acyltransferase